MSKTGNTWRRVLALGLIAGTAACSTTNETEVAAEKSQADKANTSVAEVSKSVEDTKVNAVENDAVAEKAVVEKKEQSAQEKYLSSVLSMRDEGRISDVQASYMIQALFKKEGATEKVTAPETKTVATDKIVKPKTTFPEYASNVKLTGRFRSIGSDTMDNLMKYWGIGFTSFHKKVRFFHEGKGSGTATPALMENRADAGPMSRPLKSKEIKAFKTKFSYEPTQIPVAVDCLAVYVHPDNPIAQKGLTLSQLDRVFSTTTKRGGGGSIATWGQLGLTGAWADKPIKIYGRNSASGTHSLFKKLVLLSGDYRTDIIEKVSSQKIIKEVSSDKYAIGYSGIGYKNSNVKVVALSSDGSNKAYKPERKYAYTGQYPLSRFLYLTFNFPQSDKKVLHKEFVKYVFSEKGQAIVSRNGFYPVDHATADKWLTAVAK